VSRPVRYPLTVFYDASCPLCAHEMHALRARDREGRIELVDCSAPDFDESVLAGAGVTRWDLMDRIHARDAHGRWLVGVDVLEAVYAAARLKPIAAVLGERRLRPLLSRVYSWFARNRYRLSRQSSRRIRPTTDNDSGSTTASSPSAR
jgi:predicted DCC family thiol-disulfide oxidoreductase YuxK